MRYNILTELTEKQFDNDVQAFTMCDECGNITWCITEFGMELCNKCLKLVEKEAYTDCRN